MHTITVSLSDGDYDALKTIGDHYSKPIKKIVKDAIYERIEDEYDILQFSKAYSHYLKEKKTYSQEEVKELLQEK